MIKTIPDEIHVQIVEAELALENGLITLAQKWDAVRAAITAETEHKMLAPIGENG